jgi:hypothetical protein
MINEPTPAPPRRGCSRTAPRFLKMLYFKSTVFICKSRESSICESIAPVVKWFLLWQNFNLFFLRNIINEESLSSSSSERSTIGNHPLLGGAKLVNDCTVNDLGWVSSSKRKIDSSCKLPQ